MRRSCFGALTTCSCLATSYECSPSSMHGAGPPNTCFAAVHGGISAADVHWDQRHAFCRWIRVFSYTGQSNFPVHVLMLGLFCLIAAVADAPPLNMFCVLYFCPDEMHAVVAVGCWLSQAGCVQRSSIDFVAISLGIVLSLRQAASELTLARPPQVLCTTRNFVTLLISIVIPCTAYLGLEKYLQRHDFWQDQRPNTSVSPLPLHL